MTSMPWRRLTRRVLAAFGFRIDRVRDGIGGNAFADLRLLVGHDHPLVFDAGANTGQSIQSVRSYFSNAEVHSFEPSPSVFEKLKANTSGFRNVYLHNCGLGSSNGTLELLENRSNEWTSFLVPGRSGVGTVSQKTMVPVRTIDDFCREHEINRIDILKSDTQGYDLEVFKGAERMFGRNAVRLIYCELIFSDYYEGMPPFGELYNFLISHGFQLVTFYGINYHNGLAGWSDGLFVHRSAGWGSR